MKIDPNDIMAVDKHDIVMRQEGYFLGYYGSASVDGLIDDIKAKFGDHLPNAKGLTVVFYYADNDMSGSIRQIVEEIEYLVDEDMILLFGSEIDNSVSAGVLEYEVLLSGVNNLKSRGVLRMGEFGKIVGEFADTVNKSENNSIGAKEIGRIVGDITEHRLGEVNCYPGIPGAKCHTIAFFISLTSKKYIKKRGGNISFSAAVSQIVKHMQGSCIGKTRQAVFITDNWDTNAYDEWKANLKEISKHVNLEIYLLTSGSYTEISI